MNSPKDCLTQITATTIKQALEAQSPTIAHLAMTSNGKPKAQALLVIMLADVINFLSVGQTMGETQLVQTVELILGDVNFKNLKPDDFKVCFDNAKKGFYGKSYNRIDGMIVCEWLSLYCSERADICESMAIQKAAEDNKKKNVISPEMVGFYKEVLATKPVNDKITTNVKLVDGKYIVDQTVLNKDEKGNIIHPAKKQIEKSPRDQFIQKCLTEFDDLADRNPSLDREGKKIPGKYIDYLIADPIEWDKNGKVINTITHVRPITEIEYTHIKVTEYDLNN